MSSNLAFNLAQSSLCLLLFSICYWACFRTITVYSFRRIYLLAAVVLSLLLPWIPAFSWQTAGSQLAADLVYQMQPLTVGPNASNTIYTLIWIYWSGVLVSFALLVFKLFRLLKVIDKCPVSHERFKNHPLRYTHGLISSSSFFNYLLWDNTQDLDSKHKQMILEHELAHIQDLHSWDNLIVSIAKCFIWFNPLIYWISQEFSFLHELIADQRVVNEKNKLLYLSVLAEKTLAPLVLRGAHQFNTNQTLKRIVMINNPRKRPALWRYFMMVPLLAALLYVVGCDQPTSSEVVAEESLQTEMQNDLDDKNVYEEVDVMPAPTGGMEAFYAELGQNLLYPKQARELGVEGKVYIEFVVDTDGSIKDLKVMKGIGAGCDAAALDAMTKTSKWMPGQKGGKNVAVRMQLPIVFKLS